MKQAIVKYLQGSFDPKVLSTTQLHDLLATQQNFMHYLYLWFIVFAVFGLLASFWPPTNTNICIIMMGAVIFLKWIADAFDFFAQRLSALGELLRRNQGS